MQWHELQKAEENPKRERSVTKQGVELWEGYKRL